MTSSLQICKTLLVALLVLWGIASLVIVGIWASQPKRTSASVCEERLQEVTEKLEGAKVVWGQNKVALEEMVEALRENQTRQQEQIQTLRARMALSTRSLEACHQEQEVLNGNITLMKQQLEEQKDKEANLTAHISLQREEMEVLQQNVTQASHLTASCLSLNAAAESQALAAHSQTSACQSRKQYLEKQLSKCKEEEHRSPDQRADSPSSSPSSSSRPAVWMLTLPTCWVLHLLLHLLSCSSSPIM
ncbi:unnamed protein product [Lota lota]